MIQSGQKNSNSSRYGRCLAGSQRVNPPEIVFKSMDKAIKSGLFNFLYFFVCGCRRGINAARSPDQTLMVY